jgi:hypothetical protein
LEGEKERMTKKNVFWMLLLPLGMNQGGKKNKKRGKRPRKKIEHGIPSFFNHGQTTFYDTPSGIWFSLLASVASLHSMHTSWSWFPSGEGWLQAEHISLLHVEQG